RESGLAPGDVYWSLSAGSSVSLEGGGRDMMTLDYSASTTTAIQQNYLLGIGRFDCDSSPPVLFSGFAGITLDVGHGGIEGNAVPLTGTAAGVPVTLNGLPGARDNFSVDTTADAILGPVTIHGQRDDIDFASYYDFHNATAHTYVMTADTVSRDGQA